MATFFCFVIIVVFLFYLFFACFKQNKEWAHDSELTEIGNYHKFIQTDNVLCRLIIIIFYIVDESNIPFYLHLYIKGLLEDLKQ